LKSLNTEGITPGGIAFAPKPSDFEALLHRVYLEDHLIHPLKNKIVDSYACLFGPATQLEKVKAVATGWVYLGILMLHLYIPNIPLDPNAVNVDLKRRLSITCKRLADEIELQRIGELLVTGNIESLLLESLQNRLLQEQVRLSSLPPSSDSQRDIVELQTLLSELLQFHNQLLNVERMNGMLEGLNISETSGTNKEHVNQDSWARFLERIQTKYTTLSDIIYPVVYWMNRIRFGTSLLRHSVARHQEEERYTTTSFLESITAFPSTLATTYLLRNIQPPPHLRPVDWASIRIGATIVELRLGVPVGIHHEALSNGFDQLFGLWLSEKLKQDEEERNSTSLYKSRKTNEQMRSEEELEAEDFRQLFPEYADVMEEASSESHRRLETMSETMNPYQLFVHLPPLHTRAASLPNFPIYPISTLHRWSNLVNSKLTWELDEHTVIFQLRSAFQHLQQLQETPIPAKGYNFYVDSNVPQVSRALEVIERMNNRLAILIRDWPDQMVLQHLSERCQAIEQLDLKSSLSKVLSALEQLLVQSDDWQRFASKEVSIEVHQQELSTLIIDWRRIELACWSHLLDFQALSFSTSLDDWWYRLYENIIHTPRAIVDEVEQTKFLADLMPLVEGFLSSSPLGQFATRLQLLEMFESYISITITSSTNPFLLRVRTVLDSVVNLYGRFSLKIQTTLSSRREEIDKDVRSFVKLASWKDINVLALKASAQRTHHHLHKCIRKFRSVLQEPISLLLNELEISDLGSASSHQNGFSAPLIKSVPSLEDHALPVHLRHLDNTLHAFYDISCGEKQPSLDLGVNSVEELSNTILGTISALQGSVPPKDTKNKTAWAKNLLTRKRKALADLLRTCKGIGLSSQPKFDAQIRQSDRLWLLEHRAPVHFVADEVKTMDSYFDRILWKLPRFQASLSSHSDDVSTRDLTKLLHFVHAVFGHALESRNQQVISKYPSNVAYVILLGFVWLQRFPINSTTSLQAPINARRTTGLLLLDQWHGKSSKFFFPSPAIQLGQRKRFWMLLRNIHNMRRSWSPSIPSRFLHFKSNFDHCIAKRRECLRFRSGLQEVKFPSFSSVRETCNAVDYDLRLADEQELLLNSVTNSKDIMAIMSNWCTEDGRAHHICQGFVHSLEVKLEKLTELPLDVHTSPKYVQERPIGVMLVIMQRLEAMPSVLPMEAFIKEGMTQFRRIGSNLNVPHLWQEIRLFLTALEGNSSSTVLLQRLLPFIQQFNMLLKAYLNVSILWAKSLFKLASILTNLGQDLADRGFCKPQDLDDQNAKSDDNAKMDGTGMGEGMGDQNVSHEIEEESQVEGMQGEETQSEEKKDQGDKDSNTLEMEQDFDGDLENVEGENGEEDDQTEDEEEVEETMENLDPADPDAVDEKLWGDKNGSKDKKDELESDQPSKDTTQDVEMAAKQDESKPSSKRDKSEEIATQDKDGHEDTEGEVPPEEGPDVDNQPNEAGAPMDDRVQEDEILDLPEGLDFELGDQVEPVGEDVDDEFGSEDEGDRNGSLNDGEENPDNEDTSAMVDATSDTHEAEDSKGDHEPEPAVVAKPDEEKGQGQQDTAGGNNSLLATGEPGQSGGTDMDLEHHQASNQQSSE
jgi:midasin